jgi:hypothetical protein
MMTTLQIVLALVGVVLIGSIVIYNIIQERRFRKDSERMFSHRREDIMLGESVRAEGDMPRADYPGQFPGSDQPSEEARLAVTDAGTPLPGADRTQTGGSPVLTSLEPIGEGEALIEEEEAVLTVAAAPKPVAGPAPAEPPATAKVTGTASPAKPAEEPAVAASRTPAAQDQGSGLDPATEYIARLKFANPTLANFSRLLSSLRRIGKPIRAFAKRADGAWEALSGNPRYALEMVELGIQLADRGGAITQDQLDVFCRALYEFSAEEGGAVSCADKQDALRAARALDLFSMDVDVLIGLNVVSSDARPFTSEAMHKLAEEAQLTLESDGTYHARDLFGHLLFTLTNQEEAPFPADGRGLTTHGVTLLFDVPRVADGLAVFDRMTRLGFDLAWRLEGRLVDDNGRPVTEDSLGKDRARLAEFYARMEAKGIPAGGERALRLFV